MSNKPIYQSPVSQSVEAVLSLLTSMGVHRDSPPASVKLSDSVFLVLSARQDQYYVTTAQGCSCPSHQWRGGPCKHQKKYLGMEPTPSRIPTLSGKGFKPILEAA